MSRIRKGAEQMSNIYDQSNDSFWYSIGAKYTIHVCDLDKNGFFDGTGSPLADYPIWDESFRSVINEMIIQHYYMYEIGQETERQFWLALRSKMFEIMPRLNVLFEARGLRSQYDPLKDHDHYIDHVETGTLDTTDNDTETKSSTNDRTIDTDTSGQWDEITRFSDTPQQNINHLGYGTDDSWINQWLTSGQIVNNTHSDQLDSTINDVYGHTVMDARVIDTDTTRNYTQHFHGRKEPGQRLAALLAETAYDIETQLLDSLRNLFLNLYES